ncbi:Hemicentin-2 [Halotydeus destructor]|nr:Hemicentin-2 [Halotydeus destructor]
MAIKLLWVVIIYCSCFSYAEAVKIPLKHRRSAPEAPEIIKQSANLRLQEEAKFTLLCSLSKGSSPVKYSWMKDNKPIDTSIVKIVSIEAILASSLTIEKLKSSDAGNYTCQAQNTAGHDKYTLQLTVKQSSKWLKEPNDVITTLGQDVSIECNAIGSPSPVMTWFKLGQSSREKLYTGRNLRLDRITNEAAGSYECEAVNGVDEVLRKTIRISVNVDCVRDNHVKRRRATSEAPAIIKQSSNLFKSQEGEKFTLSCTLNKGTNPMEFSWMKNGLPLVGREVKIVNIETLFMTTLTIEKLESRDAGNYTCKAENVAGQDSHTLQLTIKQALKWIKEPQDVTSAIGQDISVECGATGSSALEVSWHKLNKSIRQKLFNGHFLRLNRVTAEVSGLYECVADDGVGEVLKKTIRVSVNETPRWLKEPQDSQVVIGQHISVECSANGSPTPAISWFKLNQPDNRRLLDGNFLKLNEVSVESAGSYECVADNGVDEVLRKTIRVFVNDVKMAMKLVWSVLIVFVINCSSSIADSKLRLLKSRRAVNEAPEITKRTNILHSQEESKFTVLCSLNKGSSPVKFSWFKDNVPISRDSVTILDLEAVLMSTLIIDKLKYSDAGNYTCKAQNTAGQDSHTQQLIVKQTPKWLKEPQDVIVAIGHDISVECSASGSPTPVISWFKLNQQKKHKLYNGNYLRMSAISEEAVGVYECLADNGVDEALVKTIKVSVNVLLLCAHFAEMIQLAACVLLLHAVTALDPPKISPIINAIVHENTKLKKFCTAESGSPPLTFEWFKNGGKLDNSVKITNQEDFSVLAIDSVQSKSAGNYTCTVTNSVGSDRKSFEMTVRLSLKWLHEPDNISAKLGSNVISECSAIGYPEPQVVWRRHGDEAIVARNNLQFDSISEYNAGVYECIVSNDNGVALRKTIKVSVVVPAKFETKFAMITGKRGESVKLECPAQGDQPLSVTWMKDNVSFDKRGGDSYEIFDQMLDKGLNSELILRSVERKDSAIYKCTAKNDFGTDERTIKLVVLETPASPTNLRVKEVWSRSASLVWTAPFTGNSPISKYTIQYWRRQNAPHRLHEMTVSSTQTSAIIKDLQPGLSYEVTITAENDVGRGETSESVNFVTGQEEPSAAPVDVTAEARGSSTILVTWKPPPIEHWNGQIKGFYVGYKARDSQQPFSYRTVDAKHSAHSAQTYEFFLTNLIKGSSYIIVVKAYNNAGSGPASHDIIVNLIDADLPASPRLFVTASDASSVSLRWTMKEGDSSSYPVAGYTIHYQRDSEHWLELPVSSIATNIDPTANPSDVSVPSSNTYTLKNLDGASRYNIYVTAKNRYGIGDPSNAVTVSTDGRSVQYPSPVNPNLNPLMMGDQVPYFAQPVVMIPILCAIVVIVIVLLVTFACMKKMRSYPPPDYAGFNTLSKQFTYSGNAQPMLEAANMKANFPAPYATMAMQQSQETGDPWERPLPNPKSHIYDNPQ